MTDKNIFEKCSSDFLDFLPIAICFFDSEGIIFEVNKKAEDLLKYKRKELLNQKINKLLSEEDSEEILKSEIDDREFIIKGKEGEFPTKVFSKKDMAGQGNVFMAFYDLSKSKEIEKKMKKNMKELERFNRLATGRELRMVELKRENKKLKEEKENFEKKLKKLEEDKLK